MIARTEYCTTTTASNWFVTLYYKLLSAVRSSSKHGRRWSSLLLYSISMISRDGHFLIIKVIFDTCGWAVSHIADAYIIVLLQIIAWTHSTDLDIHVEFSDPCDVCKQFLNNSTCCIWMKSPRCETLSFQNFTMQLSRCVTTPLPLATLTITERHFWVQIKWFYMSSHHTLTHVQCMLLTLTKLARNS